LYHLQKQKLDEYIDAVLLTREAKKSAISVEALLDQEVHSKIMPITDDEIEVFYSSNKSRLGMDLKEAREQIREFLRVKKIEIQRTLYLKSLRSNSRIETYLKLPPLFRAEVPITGAPAKGPEYAPVTIVKFEDFQCPYCKQFQPTVTELLSRYNGKIRLVQKTFRCIAFTHRHTRPLRRPDAPMSRIDFGTIMINSMRTRLNLALAT
jgi:thiol-disulfide isomerase/thioredoxin